MTSDALWTVVALTVFAVELQIPSIVPIQGVKLGLANTVTLFALYTLGLPDAAAILAARILLAVLLTGQPIALLYSLVGGGLALLLMALGKVVLPGIPVWAVSILGAIGHNVGQIAVAIVLMRTAAIAVYLPILLFFAILTGLFTGICATFLISRMQKLFPDLTGKKSKKQQK